MRPAPCAALYRAAGRRIRRLPIGELVLTSLARYAEAETELLTAYEGLQAKLEPDHGWRRLARERLRQLYEAWGRPELAAAFSKEWAREARLRPHR